MPSATASGPQEHRRLVRVAMVTAAVTMLGTSIVLAVSTGGDADLPRLVYVSGRDDHGALATDTVAVHGRPDGVEVGALADGTVARVADTRGTWLRIEPVDGSAGGWVDDFWLRGRVHLVDPATPGCAVITAATAGGPPRYQLPASQQVEVLDARAVDGRSWVAVRAEDDHDLSWVPQDLLSDVPGPNPRVLDGGCEELDWPEPVHEH